jgi:hypothetical protein
MQVSQRGEWQCVSRARVQPVLARAESSCCIRHGAAEERGEDARLALPLASVRAYFWPSLRLICPSCDTVHQS